MKKILLYCTLLVVMIGCGVNKQAQQLKALEDCTYKITSVEQVSVAGADLKKLYDNGNINLANLPGIALGMLRKDIPLSASLNLEIKNPSTDVAGINEFDYKILINNQELAEGQVKQSVSVSPRATTTVPVNLNANIYPFVSNSKVMNDIMRFLEGGAGGPERKGIVTIKIRPSIMVGNSLVKYPGYITIDKEVSSKILL